MQILLNEIEIYLASLIGAGIWQIPAAQMTRLHTSFNLS